MPTLQYLNECLIGSTLSQIWLSKWIVHLNMIEEIQITIETDFEHIFPNNYQCSHYHFGNPKDSVFTIDQLIEQQITHVDLEEKKTLSLTFSDSSILRVDRGVSRGDCCVVFASKSHTVVF